MRLPRFIRQGRAMLWANQAWPDFRHGYLTALDDIERTGLIPKTTKAKNEAAGRALKKVVDRA